MDRRSGEAVTRTDSDVPTAEELFPDKELDLIGDELEAALRRESARRQGNQVGNDLETIGAMSREAGADYIIRGGQVLYDGPEADQDEARV